MVVLADPMPELASGPQVPSVGTLAEQRAARRTLLAQIARLERQLSDVVVSGFPKTPVDHRVPGAAGPALLGLGELEALRDAMAERLCVARSQLAVAADREADARLRLEAMLADPGAHRFHQVTRDDLGMPGCGAYQVRPRLGIVGMFLGWWQVKLSSGCPLARRTPAGRATRVPPAWADAVASAEGPPRRASARPGRWPRHRHHRARPAAAPASTRRPRRPGPRSP